jgi:hypothetical protein
MSTSSAHTEQLLLGVNSFAQGENSRSFHLADLTVTGPMLLTTRLLAAPTMFIFLHVFLSCLQWRQENLSIVYFLEEGGEEFSVNYVVHY